VWKSIHYGPHRELALHMKRRLELTRWQQEAVHPSQLNVQNVDKEARTALATGEARISFQLPGEWLAARDADRMRRINGLGCVRPAVHGLTVVAMTEKLDDGFAGDFKLNRATAALDLHHSSPTSAVYAGSGMIRLG
jgi:hypothetical protein